MALCESESEKVREREIEKEKELCSKVHDWFHEEVNNTKFQQI